MYLDYFQQFQIYIEVINRIWTNKRKLKSRIRISLNVLYLFFYRSGKGFLLLKMSSILTNRGMDYADLDIDELVDKLTPGEIQKLLEDCDPDDSQIPPGLR